MRSLRAAPDRPPAGWSSRRPTAPPTRDHSSRPGCGTPPQSAPEGLPRTTSSTSPSRSAAQVAEPVRRGGRTTPCSSTTRRPAKASAGAGLVEPAGNRCPRPTPSRRRPQPPSTVADGHPAIKRPRPQPRRKPAPPPPDRPPTCRPSGSCSAVACSGRPPRRRPARLPRNRPAVFAAFA